MKDIFGEYPASHQITKKQRCCSYCGKELSKSQKKRKRAKFCSKKCQFLSQKRCSYKCLTEFIKGRGGTLLTPFIGFTGIYYKVGIRCNKCHHVWHPTASSVLRGHWGCLCGGSCNTKTIDILRKEGKDKGYKLLDTVYQGMKAHYRWQCPDGHIFRARGSCIATVGRGCSKCHLWLSEEKCRFILEQLCDKSFPKNRNVLGDKHGDRYELDGYNDELQVAFEYNGKQHYTQNDRFQTKLSVIQSRDLEKNKRCEEKGIRLITIPYTVMKKGDDHLIAFISNKMNVQKDIEWSQFGVFASKLNKIQHELGRQHILLSEVYLGGGRRLKIHCIIHDKVYESVANKIFHLKSTMCPFCRKEQKLKTKFKHYDKAVQLYINGMSAYAIAKLGFTKRLVLQELHRRGVKIREGTRKRKLDDQKG